MSARRYVAWTVGGALLLTAVASGLRRPVGMEGVGGIGDAMPVHAGQQVTMAPEFPAGMRWLNTERRLTLADLRGKVVLLDFWTYCCINCMHILPELKKIEEKYPTELVVIGVHSNKFSEEGDAGNIREAILRYGITHPVLVDAGNKVWDLYKVNAWPTIVLIDSLGRVRAKSGGEFTSDQLEPYIDELINEGRRGGTIKASDFHPRLERDSEPMTVLSFPGKVVADQASNRLIIADSGHNRYLVASLDGAVKDVIGSGQEGFGDGDFATASFRRPQGAALVGDKIYLCDTENHALRVADLTTRKVSTLVGNGHKPEGFNIAGRGLKCSLNSPWDVVFYRGWLFVANAGSHQIWAVNPTTGDAQPFAGSGREDIVDGAAFVPAADAPFVDVQRTAALAQTSGLATMGERLYFADAETSSVRYVELGPTPKVKTLVGQALFDFGDVDGDATVARLQHCLGLCFAMGAVYVADTYNSQIRRVDTQGNTSTYAGVGSTKNGKQQNVTAKPGTLDGPFDICEFNEPGGISYAAGKFYVADTNSDAIRVIDPAAKAVSTLQLSGLDLAAPPLTGPTGRWRGRVQELPEQAVAPGEATLKITLLPTGNFQLNALAPLVVHVAGEGDPQAAPRVVKVDAPVKSPAAVKLQIAPGKRTLTLDVVAYFCTETGEGACVAEAVRYKLPLAVSDGGGHDLGLDFHQSR
jgi:thiol-disulfide isomerase/thioredoxin